MQNFSRDFFEKVMSCS